MALSPGGERARGRVRALSRYRCPDDSELVAARGELVTERTEAYLKRVLAEAPPLTDEQRSRLAELLKPARQAIVAARIAELDGGAA